MIEALTPDTALRSLICVLAGVALSPSAHLVVAGLRTARTGLTLAGIALMALSVGGAYYALEITS